MIVTELKVNGYQNPVGISLSGPVSFSWKIEQMRAERLMLTRLLVYSDPALKHEIGAAQGENLHAEGEALNLKLAPRTRYYAKVQAVSTEREAAESDIAVFETSKMTEPWKGSWIQAGEGNANQGFLYLFSLEGADDNYNPGKDLIAEDNGYQKQAGRRILSGRLYAACSQPARILLNGSPVRQIGSEMAGSYLTCNVSNLLGDDNLLEILPIREKEERSRERSVNQIESKDRAFAAIAELYIRRADGSEDLIATGEDWLYRGEQSADWLPVQLAADRKAPEEYPISEELNLDEEG